jgi:hypothetical protein
MPWSAVTRGLAPHGYTGDRSHLHAALLRGLREQLLRICVVGGSVPFGRGLFSPREEAWPARMRAFLALLLQPLPPALRPRVDVRNLAVPAVPSYVQAQVADEIFWEQLESCHVTVVDIAVNDNAENEVLRQVGGSRGDAMAGGRHLMHNLLQRLVFADNATSGSGSGSRGVLYFETFPNSNSDGGVSGSRPIHTPREADLAASPPSSNPAAAAAATIATTGARRSRR